MKKIKKSNFESDGFVYSTNPNFMFDEKKEQKETLIPSQQKLKVRLDAKHRAGKLVTIIEGFIGKEEDLHEVGKKVKTFCGTGGTTKDGEIIIQGDQREKVMQWLLKNGYSAKKI